MFQPIVWPIHYVIVHLDLFYYLCMHRILLKKNIVGHHHSRILLYIYSRGFLEDNLVMFSLINLNNKVLKIICHWCYIVLRELETPNRVLLLSWLIRRKNLKININNKLRDRINSVDIIYLKEN